MCDSRVVRVPLAIVVPVVVCLILRYVVFVENYDVTDSRGVHKLSGAQEYALLLQKRGGLLGEVKNKFSAPPVYTKNLPVNLAKLPLPDKTSIFISIILPNVIRVNDEILKDRDRLISLLDKKHHHRRLRAKEQWWLNRLAWRYGCDPEDERELLLRVDGVPVALALAQAINESGWGTSRFALDGNNLYGQHLSANSKGKYIISRQGNVKVAAFDTIFEATRSYIHNLNSVWAYDEMRRKRSELREKGTEVTGYVLAGGLKRYSELGMRYIRDLRYIIKRYELEKLNQVQIMDHKRRVIVQFVR